MRRAVDGLGDLIDEYEFHYPQELSEDNLDEVREALGGHGIYCIATGLHLDPRFGRGGLVSPDEATRAEASAAHGRGGRLRGLARRAFHHLAGDRGLQLPVPDPVSESWDWLVDGIGEAAQRCADHGVLLFLEHKNSSRR